MKSNRKEGAIERSARLFRNINILGALALGGAALIAPPVLSLGLGTIAGAGIVGAAGAEGIRAYTKNRRQKSPSYQAGP